MCSPSEGLVGSETDPLKRGSEVLVKFQDSFSQQLATTERSFAQYRDM